MIKVVYPEGINLINWAGALVFDYAEEFIPKLEDEKKWQEWGAMVANSGVFKKIGIPTPSNIIGENKKDNIEDWQIWAKMVYICMANELDTPQNIIV